MTVSSEIVLNTHVSGKMPKMPTWCILVCVVCIRTQCRVGGVFCTFAHYLKMYAVYLNNVDPCRRLLVQLARRSRDFDDAIKRLEVRSSDFPMSEARLTRKRYTYVLSCLEPSSLREFMITQWTRPSNDFRLPLSSAYVAMSPIPRLDVIMLLYCLWSFFPDNVPRMVTFSIFVLFPHDVMSTSSTSQW